MAPNIQAHGEMMGLLVRLVLLGLLETLDVLGHLGKKVTFTYTQNDIQYMYRL